MNVRRTAKQALAFALRRSGAGEFISRVRRQAAGGRRVLVFGYHRVCRDFALERERSIESGLISAATFQKHAEYLARHFELANMSRALDVLRGRAQARRDLACITFDDGYREVLEHALPVLRALGAPATLYVSSGVVDRAGHFPHDRLYARLAAWQRAPDARQATPAFARLALARAMAASPGGPRRWLHALIRDLGPDDLEHLSEELRGAAGWSGEPSPLARALDWDGVRELADGGFEIGAHTVSHAVLTHLDRPAVEADLAACRAAIERETGRAVRHFAFCNGYYNDTVVRALRRQGFQSAVTTEDRLNLLGDNPYRIGRRVLWEGSAMGGDGRQSESLLACQLDDTWAAVGFDASEPGLRPEPLPGSPEPSTRSLA